jgi:hypothetical protein
MAVEINGNGGRISLTGADAARFVEELKEPNKDPRRLEFLRRSDEVFAESFSSEPIRDLPSIRE